MLFSLHEGNRRQHWNGGLAHRHHVQVRSQRREHADAVIHVIRQIELALGQRHLLGITPVGDEHLMAVEERRHRAAQQRGVVA